MLVDLAIDGARSEQLIVGASGADAAAVEEAQRAVDRLGIKFGTGVEGTLGVSTELLKAGIGKDIIGDATELALKAKNAMDIDVPSTNSTRKRSLATPTSEFTISSAIRRSFVTG